MGKPISKKTHAKILGVQYGIYKIIYYRGWKEANELICELCKLSDNRKLGKEK